MSQRPAADSRYAVRHGITARDRLRAFGAGLGLLALLVAVPLVLVLTIGNPVPGGQDLINGDVSDQAVIAVLATIAWLAWAQFAVAVVVETLSLLARAPMPRRIPGVMAGQQQLARGLVTAIMVLIPALSPVAGAMTAAHAAAATSPAAAPAATATATPGPAPVAAQPVSGQDSAATSAATSTAGSTATSAASSTVPATPVSRPAGQPATHAYTIRHDGPGTYWDLAERYLGDGARWHEIWDLNEGRHQDDGSRMTSAGLLRPGWTVLIPGSASADSGAHDGPVVVHRGDTLSEIAQDHDTSWPALFDRNEGRAEPGGKHFTDPDHIEPGWTIDTAEAQASRGGSAGTGVSAETAIAEAVSARTSPRSAPATAPSRSPSKPPSKPAGAPAVEASPAQSAQSDQSDQSGEASGSAGPHGEHESSSLAAFSLGTGAGLLAAATLSALLRCQRRQFRHRLPGQTIDVAPPRLMKMEKTLLTQGGAALADAIWLDEALRDLAARVTASGNQLPDIAAVRMDEHVLELVSGPAGPAREDSQPPAPWLAHPVSGRWQLHRPTHTPARPVLRRQLFAPFPTLVSIGYSDAGDYWLIDLEKAGSLSLIGDRERCLDLARFIAAELSHNPWSEQLQVTLVGFGAEMEGLNPDRTTYTTDGPSALARFNAQLRSNLGLLRSAGLADALRGREQDVAADQWMPHVLLIDPAHTGTGQDLDNLLLTLSRRPGRSAAAVVLPDDGTGLPHTSTDWQLTVGDDGYVIIPALGLRLHAQQLHAQEASDLTQLLSAATHLESKPPPPARGDAPWDALSDATGAPIPGLTVPRPEPSVPAGFSIRLAPPAPESPATQVPEPVDPAPEQVHEAPEQVHEAPEAAVEAPASTVLPQPVDSMLATTATTGRDVEALAPVVTDRARRTVEEADAGLDDDLAAWHSADCDRPRLTLLGPLQVRTAGVLPADRPRVAWHTEVVAYLAAHPRGVTAEQLGTDLWPLDPDIASKSKLRQAVYLVRRWLGDDPVTGEPFLPAATTGASGGASRYRLEGLLTDADLFRRLRLRGVARGSGGMADLEAALDLVTGPPFDQRRPGGYAWLVDTPLDHEYTGMIVDVAHLVATHHLAEGRPDQATLAAKISLSAGSHDDVALLDLVAAADAQDNRAEAAIWVRQILANHDADVEEDLPPRTAEVLHRRRWLEAAS